MITNQFLLEMFHVNMLIGQFQIERQTAIKNMQLSELYLEIYLKASRNSR